MTYAPNARGLAALAAKATEGPWAANGLHVYSLAKSPQGDDGWTASTTLEIRNGITQGGCGCCNGARDGVWREEDAALIAKTPDLAALLLEARALFLAPAPGSIETQRRIAAFLEATE